MRASRPPDRVAAKRLDQAAHRPPARQDRNTLVLRGPPKAAHGIVIEEVGEQDEVASRAEGWLPGAITTSRPLMARMSIP
jgi:hypothetical protein